MFSGSRICCSIVRTQSLTEFLTDNYSAPGGPQDTRRTGSTRLWDVSGTGGPQGTRRTISGSLRIWRLGVRVPRGAPPSLEVPGGCFRRSARCRRGRSGDQARRWLLGGPHVLGGRCDRQSLHWGVSRRREDCGLRIVRPTSVPAALPVATALVSELARRCDGERQGGQVDQAALASRAAISRAFSPVVGEVPVAARADPGKKQTGAIGGPKRRGDIDHRPPKPVRRIQATVRPIDAELRAPTGSARQAWRFPDPARSRPGLCDTAGSADVCSPTQP